MRLLRIAPLIWLVLMACTRQKEETKTHIDTLSVADTVAMEETLPVENIAHDLPNPTDPVLIEYKDFVWDLDKSNPYSVRTATEKYEQLFRGKPKPLADTAMYWFLELYASVTDRLNEQHMLNSQRYDSLAITEGIKLSAFLTGYRDTLAATGHRVIMDEGSTYIEQDRTFIEKAFYPHVSPAMVNYLAQVHKENEEGFGTDGGLIIGPETLAARIAWWERFYTTNPDFIFQYGRDDLKRYVWVLMNGVDNTPLYFDREDGKKPALEEYYVKAYTHLFAAYPDSKIAQRLRPYYTLLLAHDLKGAEKFQANFKVM